MDDLEKTIRLESVTGQSKEELVAEYKRVLQELINRRPSGTRLKIAKALDRNKSFVSQITNPAYTVPVPAKHLNTIFELCRFSIKERETFLQAYTAAHPNYKFTYDVPEQSQVERRKLVLNIPVLDDPEKQSRLEEMIKEYARQLFTLV